MERTKVQLFLSPCREIFPKSFTSDIRIGLYRFKSFTISCLLLHQTFYNYKSKKEKYEMAFDFFRKLFSTLKRKNILFKKVFLEAINSSNI